MATVINFAPSGYASAHYPMWYELQSNQSGQTDFKYVFDLYVNNAFVTRQKLFPDPTDNKGYFDVSPIVRNYFDVATVPFTTGSNTFSTDWGLGEFYIDFYAIVGEEYSGTPYVSGDVTGSNLSAYNWAKRKQIFNQLVLNNYIETFVSNRPANSTAYFAEPLIIGAWGVSGSTYTVKQTHYVQGTNVGNASTSGFTAANPKHADVKPPLFVNSDADSVVMQLMKGTDVLDTKTVNIVCHPRYTPVTLLFLNRLGCWDSFTFGLFNEVSIDAERKSFEQNPYVGRSNSIGANFLRESVKTYAVSYKTKWKLTSDPLTKDEYKWLEELITSPLVYVYMPNAEFKWQPVMIAETNYQIKDHLIKKDAILELNIEFSEQDNTQYR